jgi:hypothetical protein
MYYVFEGDHRVETWAKVQGEMPNFLELEPEWHWWSDDPLPVPFPETTFLLPNGRLRDRYKTGSIFDLYSERLAELLHGAGVKCEYFQVNILRGNQQKHSSRKYYAFHLMETLAAIDYAKSELTESMISHLDPDDPSLNDILRIQLTEEFLRTPRPLVRDVSRPYTLLLHQSLKDLLTQKRITGCKYIPYQNYRDVSDSDIFQEG